MPAAVRTPLVAIVCGGLILSLAMGIRQTFGLFLPPVTADLCMARETFSLAMAVQNLLWGAVQPVVGMIADRYGAGRVVTAGAAAYVAGLVVMSGMEGTAGLQMGGGVLIGLAMAATGFSVVLGAVARRVPEEKRSMALGLVSAGGSFGQFAMAPVGQALIAQQGWQGAFLSMAVLAALMVPLALAVAGRPSAAGRGHGAATLRVALSEALSHRGYLYLTAGFFVCGFQVVFVAVHLPAYLRDLGLPGTTAATALALIGIFNIAGTYACGALGGMYPKKWVLAGLYVLRAMVIAVFLAAPKSEMSVYIFASALGFLWLGTVPLTSGLVGHIFGVRYLSTLFGIVFFGHQVGSFLGVWLGGVVYDATGSYDAIWIASIVLGLAAALLHAPIAERPLAVPAGSVAVTAE
ncbi:MFS transporter [Shumkonia mesophila]|uniref:MFS transporter n=1 Tax=Shumkonia mesophila TaxID=2838854 RepID=UPI0029341E31|nr:MFS transporter [Shumkonia mesophila]